MRNIMEHLSVIRSHEEIHTDLLNAKLIAYYTLWSGTMYGNRMINLFQLNCNPGETTEKQQRLLQPSRVVINLDETVIYKPTQCLTSCTLSPIYFAKVITDFKENSRLPCTNVN